MRLRTLIYALGYNDHFIYFVFIFFTVAFCVMTGGYGLLDVMIIHYFSFLNVNFRLNNKRDICIYSNALNLSSGEQLHKIVQNERNIRESV